MRLFFKIHISSELNKTRSLFPAWPPASFLGTSARIVAFTQCFNTQLCASTKAHPFQCEFLFLLWHQLLPTATAFFATLRKLAPHCKSPRSRGASPPPDTFSRAAACILGLEECVAFWHKDIRPVSWNFGSQVVCKRRILSFNCDYL